MITQTEFKFVQSLQSIFSEYIDIPRVNVLVKFSLSYTKVNIVIIELYKPRATHMKYTEGK